MPTPQQQAQKIVQQILGPQIKSTQEQYRNQGAGLNAAYQALATMNAGVAPSISATYDAASARQAVIAKGYADGYKQASEKAAFDANALLAQNNSPQTVTSAGEAGANALYGFGGAIPAGTLNQQGAAFTAAAKFLPGQDRNLGIDAVKSANIGGRSAVADLEAKRPGLVQDALGQITDAQVKARAAKTNEDLAASLIGDRTASQLTAKERIKLERERVAQSAQRVQTAIDRLNLDRDKLNLARDRENRLKRGKKKGGYTPAQLRDEKVKAFQSAADAFDQEMDPTQVLSDLIVQGSPPSVALKAIQNWAKRRGANKDWKQMLKYTIGPGPTIVLKK